MHTMPLNSKMVKMVDFTSCGFYDNWTVQKTQSLVAVFLVPEHPSSLALPVDMYLSFRANSNGSSCKMADSLTEVIVPFLCMLCSGASDTSYHLHKIPLQRQRLVFHALSAPTNWYSPGISSIWRKNTPLYSHVAHLFVFHDQQRLKKKQLPTSDYVIQ